MKHKLDPINDSGWETMEGDSISKLLEVNRVLKVQEHGDFIIFTEMCDAHFSLHLTKPQAIRFATELLEVAIK
jgi:hypothetical protein